MYFLTVACTRYKYIDSIYLSLNIFSEAVKAVHFLCVSVHTVVSDSFALEYFYIKSMLENSHWNYEYFDMRYANIYCEMEFIGFFWKIGAVKYIEEP